MIRRYLDPADSLEEVLFGVIMVLTFTLGAGLIVEESEDATTELLLAILGCNVAWGLIDAGMYAMGCILERSRKSRLLESLERAANERDALAIVGRELDERLEPLTSAEERERFYREIIKHLRSVTPERTRLTREVLFGAVATFGLVFASTIPAIVPFLVFHDRFLALRVSNLLLLVMLFLAGFRWARATHANAWLFGTTLLGVGLVLVAIAIALGG
ncbi:MAG TPA: VIT1/CCC1 transporter family protein [Candidatus Polarisedimenticolaceae bacterium]|nr:VIT1/CCC1 transporter family protein [Candidatus Polarisedimenticolaceae bacterium]